MATRKKKSSANQVTNTKIIVLYHWLCYEEQSFKKPVAVTEDFNAQHLANSSELGI